MRRKLKFRLDGHSSIATIYFEDNDKPITINTIEGKITCGENVILQISGLTLSYIGIT